MQELQRIKCQLDQQGKDHIDKELKHLQSMFSKQPCPKQLEKDAYKEIKDLLPETAVPIKEEEVPEADRAMAYAQLVKRHVEACSIRPHAKRKSCPSPKYTSKNRRGCRSWRVSGGARRSRKPVLSPHDLKMKRVAELTKQYALDEKKVKKKLEPAMAMAFVHVCSGGEENESKLLCLYSFVARAFCLLYLQVSAF